MTRRPASALSELSVTEFLTLARVGFFPHGLVIGSSMYEAGNQYDWRVATREVETLSGAMRDARTLAMNRMRKQAIDVGAEGVVDVRLELEHHLWRGARQVVKFVAMGTAVGFDRDRAPEAMRDAPSLCLASGAPFTSDLTGSDFVTLLRAGYRPVTLAMASCVYGLDPRELRAYRGQDAEITKFTQAFFDARELAMERLQEDVFRDHKQGSPDAPIGIVGMTVAESTYGDRQAAPLVEFTAVGTAIAHLSPTDPRRAATAVRPQLVVPLDR
ncbi:MAG: heavy metal-binding domain-containing protein [Polyangiales bacterium]